MVTDSFFQIFFWLVFFHFLADFPLQGEFLARFKNPKDSLHDDNRFGEGSWRWGLWGHAIIHGGLVYFATGMMSLGIAEAVAHAIIDKRKVENKLSFHQDQWLHIAFKALWAVIAMVIA